jgi:hypothetical protein
MPMPQNAVRGCPVIDLRQGMPAISKAALTTVPDSTCSARPLTVMVIALGKDTVFTNIVF